jgi:hypothetical protein
MRPYSLCLRLRAQERWNFSDWGEEDWVLVVWGTDHTVTDQPIATKKMPLKKREKAIMEQGPA